MKGVIGERQFYSYKYGAYVDWWNKEKQEWGHRAVCFCFEEFTEFLFGLAPMNCLIVTGTGALKWERLLKQQL